MDLKLIIAIGLGKLIAALTKITGTGATAAPGLYALKIDPNLVKKLTKRLKYGSIVISGTNGKTTTSRLTSDILSTKFKIIHNRQGSNLLRGIASTLVSKSSILGQLNYNLGIWEVDEGTLPEAFGNISVNIIVLLNLFRDQLDRYGEVDSIRHKWQKELQRMPKKTILILNADDPGILILKQSFRGETVTFGVNDQNLKLPKVESVADVKHCLRCGSKLDFKTLLSAHLGHYRCPVCNFRRILPRIAASNLKFNSNLSTRAKITINGQNLTINYNLPGLYNVYNVLATVAVGHVLNIKKSQIREKIKSFSAAFGRYQSIKIRGKKVVIFLIKNPAGANEVLRTIAQTPKLNLLVVLNDKVADGKDVSWIWDTNWEILTGKVDKVTTSGIRRWDMANRLKYAGIKVSKKNVYKEINYSIDDAVQNLNKKDTLYVLPTYTGLLQIQKILPQIEKGVAKWQKQ